MQPHLSLPQPHTCTQSLRAHTDADVFIALFDADVDSCRQTIIKSNRSPVALRLPFSVDFLLHQRQYDVLGGSRLNHLC